MGATWDHFTVVDGFNLTTMHCCYHCFPWMVTPSMSLMRVVCFWANDMSAESRSRRGELFLDASSGTVPGVWVYAETCHTVYQLYRTYMALHAGRGLHIRRREAYVQYRRSQNGQPWHPPPPPVAHLTYRTHIPSVSFRMLENVWLGLGTFYLGSVEAWRH